MKVSSSKKEYLISLYHTRSMIALAAGILVVCLAAVAVTTKLLDYAYAEENRLHYFTIQSNILAAVGAAFLIPYAIEGIRKKRFTLPRWLVVFHYACAACAAITFVTAIVIILPVMGRTAVTGTDFWMHLIVPICNVVLFQCVETGTRLSRRDTLIALIPYWLYIIVYYIEVCVIGKENGGWSDFYMTQEFFPIGVSLILMLVIGYGVAAGLRAIQNRLADRGRARITRLWTEDMEPAEVLIEAFGLGRFMGAHCDASDLAVPVDILSLLEERYGVSLDALTKAYLKGSLDAMKGRDIE